MTIKNRKQLKFVNANILHRKKKYLQSKNSFVPTFKSFRPQFLSFKNNLTKNYTKTPETMPYKRCKKNIFNEKK